MSKQTEYSINDNKNSAWLSIQFITSLITSFLVLKLNIVKFGESTFGLWILFASFWGISSVVDLGFGTAVIKYISQSSKKKRISAGYK